MQIGSTVVVGQKEKEIDGIGGRKRQRVMRQGQKERVMRWGGQKESDWCRGLKEKERVRGQKE